MAETSFIKTTTFGGYDKAETDKQFEALTSLVCELKNELRETKLTLEEYKKGTDEEKAHESVLAVERAKLTEVQVKNDNLNKKNKNLREELGNKDKTIAELKAANEEFEKKLADADLQIKSLDANGSAAALSTVFIEAQKSANMLVSTAEDKAKNLEADSKKLAENIVIEANNKAAKIVYEAEKAAAETEAKAKNDAEAMKSASGNLKAVMLEDIEGICSEIVKVKEFMEAFQKEGFSKIEKSEEMLNKTKGTLTKDGVPVFTVPESVKANLPEQPTLEKPDYNYAQFGGAEKAEEEPKTEDGMNLADILKQAESLGSNEAEQKPETKEEEPKQKDTPSGGVDLDALLKQASSLE